MTKPSFIRRTLAAIVIALTSAVCSAYYMYGPDQDSFHSTFVSEAYATLDWKIYHSVGPLDDIFWDAEIEAFFSAADAAYNFTESADYHTYLADMAAGFYSTAENYEPGTSGRAYCVGMATGYSAAASEVGY